MKRINFFLVLILILLIATILLIVQNLNLINVKFLFWSFSTYLGLFGIIFLFSGVLIMWIILLITHYRELSNLRNELKEKDKTINELKEQLKKYENQNTQNSN